MVRIKKDGKGGYIDRDTGRSLTPSEYKPIIERFRKSGSKGAVQRWQQERGEASPKPAKEPKIQLKKIGKEQYIDRRTGRELSRSEWGPRVSAQRAFGQMSKNKRIQHSLISVIRKYDMTAAEAKQRYVNFVKAYDRYGDQVSWAEYMYP